MRLQNGSKSVGLRAEPAGFLSVGSAVLLLCGVSHVVLYYQAAAAALSGLAVRRLTAVIAVVLHAWLQ
jgi:hypothetical protein